jgi:hypothetical protein
MMNGNFHAIWKSIERDVEPSVSIRDLREGFPANLFRRQSKILTTLFFEARTGRQELHGAPDGADQPGIPIQM